MIDTLLIAIVMVTDTTTMKTRFQSAFRDVDMVFKVRKMVYEESKKQSKNLETLTVSVCVLSSHAFVI